MCNALDLLTFWVMQERFADTWSSGTSQQIMVFWKKSRGTWWKITAGLQQGNILVRSMKVFSCVLIGIGLWFTNPPVVQYPAATMLTLGYSKSTGREVFGCATCFCCRANTHTIHRAALLSHWLVTSSQSLEICLVMQKIQPFLNPAQWAAVGNEEWLGLATVLASHTYWKGPAVGLGLFSSRAFGSFSKSLKTGEKMP